MKNKLMIFTVIFLISITVAGGTFAFFSSDSKDNLDDIEMGVVKVEVIEKNLEDVRVRSLGTSDCYIRVRLVPKWSDPSLSISNIDIEINKEDWKYADGYYYYKYSVRKNEETSSIINAINIGECTPEYEGASFKLKVVSQGVQNSHEVWKEIWGIRALPF